MDSKEDGQGLLVDDDIEEEMDNQFTNPLSSLPPETDHTKQPSYVDGITPFHIMIASGIGSVGIAFGAIPILVSQDDFQKDALDIIPIIGRAVCAFVLLVLSSAFLVWKACETRHSENENEKERQLTSSISDDIVNIGVKIKIFVSFIIWDSPSLLQVFVFGLGSMLTSALDVYNNIKSDQAAVYLVNDSIRIPAIFLQMIFYTWYVYVNHVGTRRDQPRWHHVSIAMMIGAQVWLWVSDTTEPLWTLDSNQTLTNVTTNTSDSGTGFMFTLEHFLEPFHVEFSTISIGLLYSIWNTAHHKVDVPRKKKDNGITSSQVHTRKTSSKWWSSLTFHIILASILAIFYTIISTYILFHPCSYDDNCQYHMFQKIILYAGIAIVYFGLGLQSGTVYVLYKLSSLKVKSSQANLSQYLLVITAIAVIVLFMLKLFAAGYVLRQDLYENEVQQSWMGDYILEVLLSYGYSNVTNTRDWKIEASVMFAYPFVIIFQVWLQTLVLMEAERRQNLPKSVKLILVYIIAINFGEWLQTGISLGFDRDGRASDVTPVMNTFFGDTYSRIIRLCLYPFIVLYRFHSAVVAWEVIIEDDEEDVDTKMITTINIGKRSSIGSQTENPVSPKSHGNGSVRSEANNHDNVKSNVTVLSTTPTHRPKEEGVLPKIHVDVH